jgi:hypothetical protein
MLVEYVSEVLSVLCVVGMRAGDPRRRRQFSRSEVFLFFSFLFQLRLSSLVFFFVFLVLTCEEGLVHVSLFFSHSCTHQRKHNTTKQRANHAPKPSAVLRKVRGVPQGHVHKHVGLALDARERVRVLRIPHDLADGAAALEGAVPDEALRDEGGAGGVRLQFKGGTSAKPHTPAREGRGDRRRRA